MQRLARDREEEQSLAGRIEELRRGIEEMGNKVGETVSGILLCFVGIVADQLETGLGGCSGGDQGRVSSSRALARLGAGDPARLSMAHGSVRYLLDVPGTRR